MKKIWFLFKETTYHIVDDKFVQDKKGFYLYNDKNEARYLQCGRLDEAINVEDFKIYKGSILSYPIIRGTVPFFDSRIVYIYSHYIFEEIRSALPEIETGSTFIDKVPIFNYEIMHSSNKLKSFASLALKYKKYIETKNHSFKITSEEKERLEDDLEGFMSVTLLYASEEKPTIDDIDSMKF